MSASGALRVRVLPTHNLSLAEEQGSRAYDPGSELVLPMAEAVALVKLGVVIPLVPDGSVTSSPKEPPVAA